MTNSNPDCTNFLSRNKIIITWLNTGEMMTKSAKNKDYEFGESWLLSQYEKVSTEVAYQISEGISPSEDLLLDFNAVGKGIAKFADKSNTLPWKKFEKLNLLTEFTWKDGKKKL